MVVLMHCLSTTAMAGNAAHGRLGVQVVIIGSKHKRISEETDELYRTESGWGEVDNCWGQIGYVNALLYKPDYEDIRPNTAGIGKRHSPAKVHFRAERNADIFVHEQRLGDLLAVALRNAALPYAVVG
jgi:hypothetical protein